VVVKLNTKEGRFRAIQYTGPVDFGPSNFRIVACKWLGKNCEGPYYPDGSMVFVVNGLARRVSVGDWLVRFRSDLFQVLPDAVTKELFEEQTC
jgi:hypothetical protein